MSGGDLGVSAFPEGESIFTWVGTIEGGKGTAYEGLSYKLSLRFPLEYPFKPPQVKFETMCFHPNVDQFGNICLDILQVFIAHRFPPIRPGQVDSQHLIFSCFVLLIHLSCY
ncbi:unnamed protein product [Linum tenue]|nr:unnamed protein product [Linum tenue]